MKLENGLNGDFHHSVSLYKFFSPKRLNLTFQKLILCKILKKSIKIGIIL